MADPAPFGRGGARRPDGNGADILREFEDIMVSSDRSSRRIPPLSSSRSGTGRVGGPVLEAAGPPAGPPTLPGGRPSQAAPASAALPPPKGAKAAAPTHTERQSNPVTPTRTTSPAVKPAKPPAPRAGRPTPGVPAAPSGAGGSVARTPAPRGSSAPRIERAGTRKDLLSARRKGTEKQQSQSHDVDAAAQDNKTPQWQMISLSFEERTEVEDLMKSLTDNHLKLLYMVSKYSAKAIGADAEEVFIRRTALMILLYEGTVKDVFDYDYAPASMYIGRRRIYVNVAQDGVDDLDDLREMGLISGLRLTTKDNRTGTAFQISYKGLQVIHLMRPELRDIVDTLVYHTLDADNAVDTRKKGRTKQQQELPPVESVKEFLQVEWNEDEGCFYLVGESGYRVKSDVTETEDVSYVSSPYIPKICRFKGRPTRSYSHRAAECLKGADTIRDDLSEAIVLDEVNVLVGEWIPFGANQIVDLNDKLGAMDRVKGGFFTSVVDKDPSATTFSTVPGMTSVEILDAGLTTYLNFEAEIRYPETPGVVQVENFGIHIPVDGCIVCGLKVEAIDKRILNQISLDKLSRLLVDVHQDSSVIIDSLVSQHQRSLLDTTYSGDSGNRDKFNIILGNQISPKLPAEKYLDKEDLENELKQVIGQTLDAVDIDEDTILIVGRHGLLLGGPSACAYEDVLLSYLSLLARDVYIKNLFNRVSVLGETMNIVRKLIMHHEENPNSIERIRLMLSKASRDIILINECLQYANESLQAFEYPEDVPADGKESCSRKKRRPRKGGKREAARKSNTNLSAPDIADTEPAFRNLVAALDIAGSHFNLLRRVEDMKKNVDGSQHELDGLRELTDVISESQMFRLQESMQANTKNLEEVMRTNERSGRSLEIMQVILSGTLAFEILDRVTGEWTVVDTDWARSFIVDPLISVPGVWFGINMGFWMLMGTLLIFGMRWFQSKSLGVITYRTKLNVPVHLQKLQQFLATRALEGEDADADSKSNIKKVTWVETRWGSRARDVQIDLMYDAEHAFVLTVYFQMQKFPGCMREADIKERFLADLELVGAVDHDRRKAWADGSKGYEA